MGLAMIAVMFYHGTFGIFLQYGKYIGCYGHWGVDVFLFVSGFGIYYALDKCGGCGIGRFYSRRIERIIPAALISGVILYSLGKVGILGLFGMELWYIRSILIIYLLSPLFYRLLKKYEPARVVVTITLLATVGVLVAVPLQLRNQPAFNTTMCWTLARLASFVVGMYIAQRNWSIRQVFSGKYICFCIIALPALMYVHYLRLAENSISTYLHLLPYVALAFCMPFICGVVCKVINFIPGVIRKSVEFFGVYSLEIYLVHEAVFNTVGNSHMRASARFIVAYGGSVLLALLLHFVAKNLLKWIKKAAILRESR